MMLNQLLAVSPIDGRYHEVAKTLTAYMSEYGLIKYRLTVMIEYVIALTEQAGMPLRTFEPLEITFLRKEILGSFGVEQAEIIKMIETKGYGAHSATNHDVKACELYLRDRLTGTSLKDVVEWVHFGCTSEDVNNLAYALMLGSMVRSVVVPAITNSIVSIANMAKIYAMLPMLARTHGQPATPTTLGKELSVFTHRATRQLQALKSYKILGKLNGASGNHNAHYVAFPEIDWLGFSKQFVESLGERYGVGIEHNPITTQIEPHDTYAELFGIMMRLNTIFIDFCQDIWRYVSDDWLVQKPVPGEVGSSTMPHKVNPINFENAEGNLGVANALFGFFCQKLPISRLQRDLSDSTVERYFGVAFGASLIAYRSINRGLSKLSANEDKITKVLEAHPEVLAEAIQSMLRVHGVEDAYGKLKEFTRGKGVTIADLQQFIRNLAIPDELKIELFALRPSYYIGIASQLAQM